MLHNLAQQGFSLIEVTVTAAMMSIVDLTVVSLTTSMGAAIQITAAQALVSALGC